MSMPTNPKVLAKLQKAVDRNTEAGDWVSGGTLPDGTFLPEDDDIEELLRAVGKVQLPPKK